MDYKLSGMLESCRDAAEGMRQSSAADLYKALEIESTTRRRKTVLKRLIQRLVAAHSSALKTELHSKFIKD